LAAPSQRPSRPDFLKYLADHIVVFDGGMGTMLYQKGVFLNRCFDELNLSAPEIVRDVHRAYLQAGADAVETNTFGANRYKLGGFGFQEKAAEINRRGAEIAREAAGDRAWVAGSVGPLGLRIEPWGPTSVEEAEEAFREQARALLEGGVDLFILETFSDLIEVRQAIRAVRSVCALPVIAQMTLEEDGNSLYGTVPEVFTRRLEEWGADVLGINCSVGPQVMLESLERMAKVTSPPSRCNPTPASPAPWRDATSTSARPSTWPPTPGSSSWRGRRSWAAAAGRPRTTSRQSGPPSAPCGRPTSPMRSPCPPSSAWRSSRWTAPARAGWPPGWWRGGGSPVLRSPLPGDTTPPGSWRGPGS